MERIEVRAGQIPAVDATALRAAEDRLLKLTKPTGSLGRLEELVKRLAAIQGEPLPWVDPPAVLVFAGDHGVTEEGVSAYPSSVTAAMVDNFLNGGAAISVLSRMIGAELTVVDVGVDSEPLPPRPGFLPRKVAPGTRNLAREDAMTEAETRTAIDIGSEAASDAIRGGARALALGEMGIGNTTSATALIAAITRRAPAGLVGRGTGIDDPTLERKRSVVQRAVDRVGPRTAPVPLMAALGGFEIAAIAGAALEAARQRRPILVDGLISTAAVLWAALLNDRIIDHLVAAHRSAEPAHSVALDHLGLVPYLDLSMRLGEGTGAVLGLVLCDAACRLLREMATFEEANVAGRLRPG